MSNNVSSKSNPFAGPLSAKSNRVGENHQQRRDFMKLQESRPQPSARQVLDKFNRPARRASDMEDFQSVGDKYRSSRKPFNDKPYTPQNLYKVESGITPAGSVEEREITDAMRLEFLDAIISRKELQSQASIRKHVMAQGKTAGLRPQRNMGSPAISAKNR
ncbi:MAG TPA: hypothetical protein PKU96_04035 [bacterium]|jgi:hypothetical protein|nr:hypothetical protein [Myxococcales bacterium]OQA61478.1 MAG: hypothetical protein BWY40_00600 [bacterium ADurb.Bin270]HPW45523.1 hypothetical protein [bacterium]HQC50781.1 hypothetical protein [bacterium]HQH80860.1 hypothetical protein [bacterium]